MAAMTTGASHETPDHGVRGEVTTGDGRTLVTYSAGEPDAPVVLIHHGTPSAGILARGWVDDAYRRGFRAVSYSRPGYDSSARLPGRTVADGAADAAAVADALGADRFSTWGLSGGGPHALACAALLPERVRRAASIAGVAPYGADNLDWLAGMGEDNVAEFGATLEGEPALRALLERIAPQMTGRGVDELIDGMSSLLPPVDVEALQRDWGRWLHDSMAVGLSEGVAGWLDDDLAFVQPWGFDLDAVTVPVLVAQGSEDQMVPAGHGEWLGAHVAGAELRRAPGQGHLSLLDRLDDVYDWLLAD